MITVTGPADARRQLAGLCQAEMRDIHREIQGLNPREETQVNGSWVPTATLEADERSDRADRHRDRDSRHRIHRSRRFRTMRTRRRDARNEHIWKPTAFICYSKTNIRSASGSSWR